MLPVEVDFSFLLIADKRLALRSSAARRIRNSQEREDRPENDGGGSRALGLSDRVLARFRLVVSDRGHNQICAVDGNHAGLDETGPRVILLDDGVDTRDGDGNA